MTVHIPLLFFFQVHKITQQKEKKKQFLSIKEKFLIRLTIYNQFFCLFGKVDILNFYTTSMYIAQMGKG